MVKKSLFIVVALLLCVSFSLPAMSEGSSPPDPVFSGLNAPDWVDGKWKICGSGTGQINGNPAVTYIYKRGSGFFPSDDDSATVVVVFRKGQKKYGIASHKGYYPKTLGMGTFRMLGKEVGSVSSAEFARELSKY